MPSDAHCHPFEVKHRKPDAEAERISMNISVAASSWNAEEFTYHETLARESAGNGGPPVALCFGVHPQLPLAEPASVQASLETLHRLANARQLSALGEVGFDLFDEAYRATEAWQEELFTLQLELAIQKGLPLVLHIRRAMHKVFAYSRKLASLPAVVFHSYSGTYEEALALRKRGIPAYFSFGTTIVLNHRKAMRACALLFPELLLFETDAPYQSMRGRDSSDYGDLFTVVNTAASLREEAESPVQSEEALHELNDEHFRTVFFHSSP